MGLVVPVAVEEAELEAVAEEDFVAVDVLDILEVAVVLTEAVTVLILVLVTEAD